MDLSDKARGAIHDSAARYFNGLVEQEMQAFGMAVIHPFLNDDTMRDVDLMLDELTFNGRWDLQVCDTEGPRVVPAETLRHAGLTARQWAKSPPPGLESLASQSFAYCFGTKGLDHALATRPIADCARQIGMASAVAEMAASSCGLEKGHGHELEEVRYTSYTAGCFLGAHSDAVGSDHRKRKVAFVLHLSDWHPQDGGVFMIYDPRIEGWQVVVPPKNSLVLFNVHGGGAVHLVTPVAQHCTKERLALTGWLVGS